MTFTMRTAVGSILATGGVFIWAATHSLAVKDNFWMMRTFFGGGQIWDLKDYLPKIIEKETQRFYNFWNLRVFLLCCDIALILYVL